MITLLDNKPVTGSTVEDLRLDLLYPSRESNYLVNDSMIVIVKKGEEMRPDMLSANFYGDTQEYDMILKHNGISNPFSINENDVFMSADVEQMRSNNTASAKLNAGVENIRQQYINVDKKSLSDTRVALVDAKRQEAEKLKILETMQKRAEQSAIPGTMLPPNIAAEGDREITVIGGKVYFGKDVVRGKEECAEPLSKSEFLARLIKNRTK